MFRSQYKVDKWGKFYKWWSAYYKPWWWPFWKYCYYNNNMLSLDNSSYGMCETVKEAEEQCKQHALGVKKPKKEKVSYEKYLGWLPNPEHYDIKRTS